MLTDEQKAQRHAGLGGSDAGVAAGVSPFKSPLRLYYEKRGELPLDEEETEAMEWGKILEEPIARKFASKTGLKVRRQSLRVATAHRFMLANIDRQVLAPSGVLECKALNAFTRIEGVADLPDYMYLQGQHYLEVYGYERLYFAILIGGQKFVQFPVERDQQTIDVLIEVEREFWRRVELGDPPPPDGSESTRELAKHLYPKDTGKLITMDSTDARQTALALLQAKDQAKQAEDRKTALENWLKFRLEDASEATIPGFGRITWKSARPSRKEVVDLTKLKAEFPDAYEAAVRVEPSGGGRRFLIKPEKGLVPHE